MGQNQSISLKQLQDLRDTLKRLQAENDAFKRESSNSTDIFKAQIEKLREEKSTVEKQLYDTEFLLGDKDRELEKLQQVSGEQQRQAE